MLMHEDAAGLIRGDIARRERRKFLETRCCEQAEQRQRECRISATARGYSSCVKRTEAKRRWAGGPNFAQLASITFANDGISDQYLRTTSMLRRPTEI
jgi:hypothetical protein